MITEGIRPYHGSVLDGSPDRRRYGRIRLDDSLSGRFGDTPVAVLELSVTGFLIGHQGRIAPGSKRSLHVDWEFTTFDVVCDVVRSSLWRLSKKMGEESVYHSGLHIRQTSRESFETLRHLIAERILRALDEQKANAHGIPPLSAYMYQPEKGDLYRRCELINGTWRKTETIHDTQPMNGFTISAEVDPFHVDMLCRTWENTTTEGRRLTRMLAELSVSKAEGIPTRRYVP